MARAGIFRNPVPYAAWAILVLISLWIGYLTDPYVFGIGTLILGWVTVPIAIAGLAVVFFSRALSGPARAGIVASLVLTGAIIGGALALLRTFKWN